MMKIYISLIDYFKKKYCIYVIDVACITILCDNFSLPTIIIHNPLVRNHMVFAIAVRMLCKPLPSSLCYHKCNMVYKLPIICKTFGHKFCSFSSFYIYQAFRNIDKLNVCMCFDLIKPGKYNFISHRFSSRSKVISSQFLCESLHKDVYIGMEVLKKQSYEDLEIIEKLTNEIENQLRLFAGNVDPYKLVEDEIKQLSLDMQQTIDCEYKEISQVVKYLLEKPSKKFRPILIITLNKLLSELFPIDASKCKMALQLQGKMIEVTEMIHTASILHDDVIDHAEIRRGGISAHKSFSNKKAILSGDFLLARACSLIAALGSPEAFQRVAIAVESLVKGELIITLSSGKSFEETFKTYLSKSYFKTASLIAESCACGAIFGGYDGVLKRLCFEIGSAIGMSFQLHDDLLDIIATCDDIGKPSLNDLKMGLITAPILLSALDFPSDMKEIFAQHMKGETDARRTLELVNGSSSIARTRLAVMLYSRHALELVLQLCAYAQHESNNNSTIPVSSGTLEWAFISERWRSLMDYVSNSIFSSQCPSVTALPVPRCAATIMTPVSNNSYIDIHNSYFGLSQSVPSAIPIYARSIAALLSFTFSNKHIR